MILYTLLSIVIAYTCAQAYIAWRWCRHTRAEQHSIPSALRISVVIASRNEGNALDEVLNALVAQRTGSLDAEIILVDDHSEDGSVQRAVSSGMLTGIKTIRLEAGQHGKRAALAAGIRAASGDIILLTDADCRPPAGWTGYISAFFDDPSVGLVAGPVKIAPVSGGLSAFQALDLCGMQAIGLTGLGDDRYLLLNGANLAVRKGSFDPNLLTASDYQSGDDLWIASQVLAAGYRVVPCFEPQAIVETRPVAGWRAFLRQRLRWGSKNKGSSQWVLVAHLGLGYLAAIATLAGIVLLFLPGLGWWGLAIVAIKSSGDLWLLYKCSGFFGYRHLLLSFWWMEWLHCCYIAGIGTLSLLPVRYVWKGRRLR